MSILGLISLLGIVSFGLAQRDSQYRRYFHTSHENMQIPNSRLLASGVNETNCLRECLDNPTCFAVEYDRDTRDCFDHSEKTFCDGLLPSRNTTHHRRIPCRSNEEQFKGNLHQYTRVQNQPDAPACRSCTLDMCLDLCQTSEECRAIDYSFNERICYHYRREVLCSEQMRTGDAGLIHATKDPCVLEGPSDLHSENDIENGFIETTDAPTIGRIFQRPFDGMVARMEGLRVRGGSLRITGVEERRCTMICRRAAKESCHAVDYDIIRRECIIHTNQTACNDLVRNSRFNHHRRESCPATIIDYCDGVECQNDGVCRNLPMEFRCMCKSGFEGRFCERNIDDCASNPCQNMATCIDGESHYNCSCVPGYTGVNCEHNINECSSNPCENEGTCVDELNGYRCICRAGFDGEDCQRNIDDCLGNPCMNGGSCTDDINEFRCTCTEQYNGTRCENAIDLCGQRRPCRNGGTCSNGINRFTCSCAPGFEGDDCGINIDECAGQPCLNEGQCIDLNNGFMCVCADGFVGRICAQNVNECQPQPCLNGATCNDGINSYTCDCASGFSGTNCEINDDDCESSPCQNEGECVDGIDSYTCTCADGFSGADCEIDIDECASSPCVNGDCEDRVDGYVCDCQPGFTGIDCDADINECESSPCQNNASCVNDLNAYVCNCLPGFTSTHCETDIDECQSNPCQNGATCVDQENGFNCTCAAGYHGVSCLEEINECESRPCQNNGQCFDLLNDHICACPRGFKGKNCEIDDDECESDPCMNGATCSDLSMGFNCTCTSGFTGLICEINVDDCDPNPCMNGGICTDAIASFSCECAPGYHGPNCELDINDCEPNPCFNGGTCIDLINGFRCNCSTSNGYEGDLCQINIDDCDSNPCRNGGNCTDLENDYQCTCPPAFVGKNCSGSELLAWPMTCLMGGTQIGPGLTAEQCMAECVNDILCLAVDYDMRDGDCLIHRHQSACNTRQMCEGKIHYQLAPCFEDTRRGRGSMLNVLQARYSGYIVEGGEEAEDCDFCSRDMCLATCIARRDCVAISFFHVDTESKCFLHSEETACNPFVPTPTAAHYILRQPDACGDRGTSAPLGDFVERSYDGPTVIPPEWQAYPGRHQLRGRQLGSANMTGDACVNMCDADPMCFALDFNSIDGSCFAHWTEDRKCSTLLDSPDVYHIKKPGGCGSNYTEPILIGRRNLANE